MIRLLLLALAAYIAWRLLNRWLAGPARPPQPPPTGFTPDPEAARTYEALYRGVYRELYPRLKPLYERIRAITGYPA